MFDSRIVDVVIGLAAVYALLALGCSWVAEWISALFELRASTLETALSELLAERTNGSDAKSPKSSDGRAAAKEIFAHPLIAPLTTVGLSLVSRGKPRPSHVPCWILARAVWDEVAPVTEKPTDDLRKLVGAITNPTVKALAESCIAEGRTSVAELRKEMEKYFDSQMERARGWYARSAQRVVVGIAIGATVALNVDSVSIAQALWRDAAARDTVVQLAERLPPLTTAPADAASEEEGGSDSQRHTPRQGSEAFASLMEQPLPIGWSCEEGAHDTRCITHWDVPLAFHRVAGWLATIVAISLGAPFWFGIANRLVGLRLAGGSKRREEETAAPEPSGK